MSYLPALPTKPLVYFSENIYVCLGKCIDVLCSKNFYKYSIELQNRIFAAMMNKEGDDKLCSIFKEYVIIKGR